MDYVQILARIESLAEVRRKDDFSPSGKTRKDLYNLPPITKGEKEPLFFY